VVPYINCNKIHDKEDVSLAAAFHFVLFLFIAWSVPGAWSIRLPFQLVSPPLVMKVPFVSAITVLACIGLVAAGRRAGILAPPLEEGDEFAIEAAGAVNTTGNTTFTQLLDHDDPSKGTFQQKFWWNSQFWAGPGSPVSLLTWAPEVCANGPKRLCSSRLVKLLLQLTVPI
jgi:hypothetical protein